MATTLAVVAAFAFVLDGALGGEHHLPTAMGGSHYHAHAQAHHSHGSTVAADHQIVDVAAHSHGSSPQSGGDISGNCCSCACCAAVVLPCLIAEAAPFVLIRSMTLARDRQADGVVPEGLRRPPRPLSIA